MRVSYIPMLLAAALLTGCEQSSTTPSAVTDSSLIPADQVMYGVRHLLTKDGVRSSVLEGDTAYLHEESQTIDLIGVRLTFYDAAGAESGTLTARTGEYDMAQGQFVARDDVVLVTSGSAGDRRVTTDELNYVVNADQLYSDAPFTMVQGGRTTRGTSFQTDSKFVTWTIRDAETTGGLPSEGFSF